MNILRAAWVIVWFGLVLAPVSDTMFHFLPERPIQENRVLTKFPADVLNHPIKSMTQLQAWFDDNFGFRNTLIRIKNQFDYMLGHSDRIHIGPDGWLFYRSTMDVNKLALARLKPEATQDIVDRVDKLQRFLRDRGVRLIVVAVPQKDVIYPEYLPSSAPVFPGPTMFDRVRAGLGERMGSSFVDAQSILAGLKAAGFQVYHRTDYHWTDWAGGEVARAIVNRIAEIEQRPDLRWEAPLPQKEIPSWSGGEASFMPLLWPVTETGSYVDIAWNDASQGSFKWLNTDEHFVAAFPWAYSFIWESHAEKQKKLPSVAVYNNSYGDAFWRTGMQFYFQRVYEHRSRTDPATEMAEAISRLPSDVKFFLLQIHEDQLWFAGLVDWTKVVDR